MNQEYINGLNTILDTLYNTYNDLADIQLKLNAAIENLNNSKSLSRYLSDDIKELRNIRMDLFTLARECRTYAREIQDELEA
jgi:hypothetical protein